MGRMLYYRQYIIGFEVVLIFVSGYTTALDNVFNTDGKTGPSKIHPQLRESFIAIQAYRSCVCPKVGLDRLDVSESSSSEPN